MSAELLRIRAILTEYLMEVRTRDEARQALEPFRASFKAYALELEAEGRAELAQALRELLS